MNDIPNQNNETKRVPTLTIIAGVFTGLNILGIIACFLFDLSYLKTFEAILFLVPCLVISSLALSFACKKDKLNAPRAAMIITNSILAVVAIIAVPYGVLRSINMNFSDRRQEAGQKAATIEKVLEAMPTYNMNLHNEMTADSKYHFCDDNGQVAKKFRSIEFTYGIDSFSEWSQTYFELNSGELKVTFAKDFDSILVESKEEHQMFGGGRDAGHNYYSMNKEEGLAIKELIDSTISIQKAAIEEENAKKIAETTLGNAITAFEKETTKSHVVMYYNDKYQMGFTRNRDNDHELIGVLKDIGEANITEWTNEEPEKGYDVFLYTIQNSGYTFHYYHETKRLNIYHSFSLPLNNSGSYSINCVVSEDIDTRIMDVVLRLAEQEQFN